MSSMEEELSSSSSLASLVEDKQAFSYPKSKIKVLLLDGVHPRAIELFENETFQVEAVKSMSHEDLMERVRDVHIIGVRSRTQLREPLLRAAKKLLAIGCFCIGTDQVDLDVSQELGIPVFNAPFANTRSVAELVIAEIIMLARQGFDRSAEVHRGDWFKVSDGCYEVRGKTLGIIGYGHVGSQVSILAESMGMKVIFYDILPKLPIGNAESRSCLPDILAEADFVTLHVPSTPDTVNLIGADQLVMMKRGSYLLNLSRGNVVDVDALAASLRSGYLRGAAVDVYPLEPPGNGRGVFENPLCGCPNTILTPHIGGSTEEAQWKIGEEVAYALIRFVNNGTTLGSVNFPNQDLPLGTPFHRIINAHQNRPGVLRDIYNILSEYNVRAQTLGTTDRIGYIMIEVDTDVSVVVRNQIAQLPNSIKTRVMF